MASSDTGDDIIISSALLFASTLSQQSIHRSTIETWTSNWPITARRRSKKLSKNRDGLYL